VESESPSAVELLMVADMNSVNANDIRELEVCYCVLPFRMSDVLGRPSPAAVSGNTS